MVDGEYAPVEVPITGVGNPRLFQPSAVAPCYGKPNGSEFAWFSPPYDY